MENNIFFKNKKEKFNPDVIANLTKKNGERKVNNFKQTGTIYNPITNNLPKEIKGPKDLMIKTVDNFDDIKKLINVKKDERSKQDQELKPQKVKALPDNLIVDKHIENFEELKKSAEDHQEAYSSVKTQQKSKYNDIMLNLKKLGILNKR